MTSRSIEPSSVATTKARIVRSSSLPITSPFSSLPPSLRPALRAFILGYAVSVGPRAAAIVLRWLRSYVASPTPRKQQRGPKTVDTKEGVVTISVDVTTLSDTEKVANDRGGQDAKKSRTFVLELGRVLKMGFTWYRFPSFCASIVGGSKLIEFIVLRLLQRTPRLTERRKTLVSQTVSSFLAAYLSIRLFQSRKKSFTEATSANASTSKSTIQQHPPSTTLYAGKTLDLTLFTVARALDIIIGSFWAAFRSTNHDTNHRSTWAKVHAFLARIADPTVFACSGAAILWCYIYYPSRLAPAYLRWIHRAASIDHRLLVALRHCRFREIIYGQDTGYAHVLAPMCEEYQVPTQWGDPAVTVPFPCELYHMGAGPSCEWHAVRRFYRSFFWAMATYAPLQMIRLLVKPSWKTARQAIRSSARSSLFLGTFIASFYYMVCLARNRVGPRLLGTDNATRQKIDSGICIGSGCAVSGWSILLEKPSRQKDLALFVAPRALGTLLPRRYAKSKEWMEGFAFAVSYTVIMVAFRQNPQRLRGVLGKVLYQIFA